MATWSSQLSIYSLTCWGCFGTFLSSLQISYHETVHRNIGLFKPLRDHNANIPLYTPTFGESINSVTQLQMHEALQSIEVHNLLKIMLNNLLGWHHTMSLPKPTISIGRYRGYRFPCGILVSCLNDKFAFILSENSVVPFFFSLDPARSGPPDSSRPLSRACQLPRTLQVQHSSEAKSSTPPNMYKLARIRLAERITPLQICRTISMLQKQRLRANRLRS